MTEEKTVAAVYAGLHALKRPKALARRLRVPRWIVREVGRCWARCYSHEEAALALASAIGGRESRRG